MSYSGSYSRWRGKGLYWNWREDGRWGMNNGHYQVKTACPFLKYTHSLDCITDYPKRGSNRRRPKRAGGTSDAGSSAPSSHASGSGSAPIHVPPPSPPTGAPGPTTEKGNADAPPANLIDLRSAPLMPGENISGMMATMSLHCNLLAISFLRTHLHLKRV